MFNSRINLALILHIVSLTMVFESLFMLFAVFVSMIYHETTTSELFLGFVATFTGGAILNLLTRKQRKAEPGRKESFIIVTVSWLALGLIGTIPYLVTHSIPNFVNAFFESVSGFTTTGSSILADIEAMPKSILFWRAETHWIGGMGIIVLVVAIMPFLKINGVYLFNSETSSAVEEKISVKIRYVARNLWLIYIGLTLAEIFFLLIGRMSLFDSICHSFATVATGGFSTKNSSIAAYSGYIQYVITLFMLLSGINFALHFLLFKREFRTVLKNEELRLYLKIIVVVGLIITFLLYFDQPAISFEKAFRDAFFQVVSIITATGFATADYLQWPLQAVLLIGILMLIGASAGSTGGGVKVIRHLIALKSITQSFKLIFFPNSLQVVRYNGKTVSPDHVLSVMTFIIFYYAIVVFGTFVMTLLGQSWASSFGAVASCMGGIGPGFGTVGPVSNFLHLPEAAKYFLAFIMILGRLEIYSVLIIFSNWFWRL